MILSLKDILEENIKL